ncbi:MAG: RsmE family RNA methyltransferase [Ginsengibacter sp.]
MALPRFFEENLHDTYRLVLSEDSSKHIAQVLRMKEKGQLLITNGKGRILSAEIIVADKKKTEVQIIREEFIPPSGSKLTIAISLIKNASRFEWFIEKATEIGVSAIIPLICKRTEKSHFRFERIQSILISAMLQSSQAWLPELSSPTKFSDVVKGDYYQKFIAHCLEEEKKNLPDSIGDKDGARIILIGPEGDFTEDEIQIAIRQNYIPVTLGLNRLRTETAGLVAAVLLK